jgi:hypothetical protein
MYLRNITSLLGFNENKSSHMIKCKCCDNWHLGTDLSQVDKLLHQTENHLAFTPSLECS